jgi:hypothetical protein
MLQTAKATNSEPLTQRFARRDNKNRMMIGAPIKFNDKGQSKAIFPPAFKTKDRSCCRVPVAAAEAKPIFPGGVPER